MKKNLFKKFICLSLLTIFSSSYVIPTLANDFKPNLDNISTKENVLLDEISKKYNLKDININELPDGIIPIKIDINNLENELLKFENSINEVNEQFNSDISTYYKAGTFTQKYSHLVGFCTANLTANITQDDKKITRVSTPNVTLTGYTFAVDISNISKDAYINSSGENAYVSANYQIDYYLLVDGLLKLFSKNVSQGFTYTYDKGITSTYFN